MGRITGGRISYAEKRNISQYENKSAEVELAFALEEGEDADAIGTEIEKQCMARVHRMLGVKSAVADDKPAEEAKPVSPRGVGRPKKDKPVEKPAEDEVDMADLLGEEPKKVAEITDADLVKAINTSPWAQKGGEKHAPGKVKKLIEKHGAKRASEIAKDKRQDFLDDLKLGDAALELENA